MTTIFGCPRCGKSTRSEFYGPCDACRDELAQGTWTPWFTEWADATAHLRVKREGEE